MLRSITVVFLVAAACGGDDPVAPDAPMPAPDAPADTATECNAIPAPSLAIPVNRIATAPPVPQGGTIVPGRYLLTDAAFYTGVGGATGPTGQMAQAESVNDPDRISYHYTQRVVDASGAMEEHSAGTYTASGTQMTITTICPGPRVANYTFDATPTKFTLYQSSPQDTLALTFTKQ